ncbi:MAG TPA: alpha/beta fold hydrolase [Solirubrobacterales bacterium]|nr:alpha/beta fold hydrolase [Solirubrobacterales bacterium]
MESAEVRFAAGDGECVGRLFRPQTSTGAAPCVVMGSGFSCVRDQGLDVFAERLAGAGFAAFAFDYRHWGESPGEPRSLMDPARQREDWRAALVCVGALDGIDSTRIAMWSYSMGTGHVQSLAIDGARVRAVVCVAPLLSGRRSLLHIGGLGHLARLTVAGGRDMARRLRGAAPYRIPVAGKPGSLAVINSPDAAPGFAAITPPGSTWRNEVCARAALAPPYSLTRKVHRISCPSLYCVFDADDVNPPALARRAAKRVPRGELRVYPGGHFAPFSEVVFDRLVADQVEFLRRHLGRPTG